jgi:hypothetical protein
MGKVGRFLSWFLLAPYFASWAVPMMGLQFTNDVELARRWRAQGVIMFDSFIILLGGLSLSRQMTLLSSLSYFWVGVLSGLFGILETVLLGTVLNRERELRLKADYDSMPRWKRRSFAFTAWTLVAAMFLAILWFAPPQRRSATPWTNLRCDAASTEMTAETCSPAAAH